MTKSVGVMVGLCAFLLVGCATRARIITDPPDLNVILDGKDFGKSPTKVEAVGTTFGEYRLQLRDAAGKVVFDQELPKDFRVWGIFWPPYGVFYNLFELHGEYQIVEGKTAAGERTWSVTPK
jgi:hypothetical protein